MSVVGSQTLQSLNPDAFLRLFITQLKNQDPNSPMDPSAMVGQLAQLTSVQQMTQLTQDFQAAFHTERLSLAKGLIGSQVTYTNNGATVSGIVEAARIADGEIGVVVNGAFVNLDAVQEISSQSSEIAPGA